MAVAFVDYKCKSSKVKILRLRLVVCRVLQKEYLCFEMFCLTKTRRPWRLVFTCEYKIRFFLHNKEKTMNTWFVMRWTSVMPTCRNNHCACVLGSKRVALAKFPKWRLDFQFLQQEYEVKLSLTGKLRR